ncbi:Actin-like protein N-terminal domain-containing protein, partial [Dysosmobacter welbionis]
PTHRYSSHGRHRRQPLRRQIRPQQSRQVDPLAAGGLKAPAQSAPASRLAVRHHHSAVRCALRCQLSGPEIGGVHLCQTHQGPAHPGRLPQKAADLRLRQHVRRIQQTVAPAGAGLHSVALPPQRIHRLPDGRAAQSQPVADLLAGDERPLLFPQQGQDILSAHVSPSSPIFMASSLPRFPLVVNRAGEEKNGAAPFSGRCAVRGCLACLDGVRQLRHPGLSVHRNSLGAQQLRRDTLSRRQHAGKGAVVDHPAAAGGTPLFQQRRLASQQAAETQGLFRAPAVLGGDIATVPGHHPVSPPLRRRTGCGQT